MKQYYRRFVAERFSVRQLIYCIVSQKTFVCMYVYMYVCMCMYVYMYVCTVYLLIYRTAKNNYFGNCLGIIGTNFYRACKVSGIIRTSKQLHAS